MAYNLIARLKLEDKLSQPIRRAIGYMTGMRKETDSISKALHGANQEQKLFHHEQRTLRDSMSKFTSEGRAYTSFFERFNKNVATAKSNVSGLHGTVVGLAGAYATVEGGKKLFDATIGSAAKQEYSRITVGALMNNSKKTDELFSIMKQQGLDSAMFSVQDFIDSSKTYIPFTKDIGQLERLTQLTERLALSNPMQGMEGASFAIREAMSGDMVSLVERFNLPRKWANDLKGKSGQEFISAFDNLLNRMGYTDALKQQVADESGLAKYAQVSEKVSQMFTDMGVDGLNKAKPMLDRIDKMLSDGRFKLFQKMGSDLISDAVSATERAVVAFDKYMQHIQSDKTWEKLSIGDKLIRITEDGMNTLNKWLATGGSDKIASATKPIAETAIGVGAAVGKGIFDGFVDYAKENPLSAVVIGGLAAMKLTNGPVIPKALASGRAIGLALVGGVAAALTLELSSIINKALDDAEERAEKRKYLLDTPLGRAYNRELDTPDDQPMYASGNMTSYEPTLWDKTKNWFSNAFSNYNGIDSVPYDGYKAILHKGEKVVPSTEVRKEDKPNVNININNMVIREEADIDRIAFSLAQQIRMAGGNMA
ncbi:hypothetical protein [Aneurinibacillus migulanus]|uniref:Uncharacterized protein n=1 Tax=Aneurinibacillus migulanus TaxID=47500 RepID=A0A0D1XZD7_ANEMI|nr:hypothetical protein [Aneurinibacillus migulanus]KIV57433.1 hypothetical protein TS65_09315 [Aneurinibacillus migulanus]KON94956.1 hypothetical protein AF333_05110 [Aneurinibacillus migulanus]MED0892755.1 hypothetical protein [Aneurinibacillus migulanus]MED1619001.1 hypothetical protein [Aneurinibacillus migulanus]SDI95400.1 hypothetical protein SAMN04487909_109212 [Aneurinibacillus migulanus]